MHRRLIALVLQALVMAVSPEIVIGQTTIVHVVDDAGFSVASDVWKLTRSDPPQRTRLGTTGQDGTLSIAEACQRGERLRAVPISSGVYNPQNFECPLSQSPAQLLVTRVRYAANLLSNAKSAEADGDSALAALLYNDLWSRTAGYDMAAATTYKVKTFTLVGEHFGVKKPWTLQHGQHVMSPEMLKAIAVFQGQAGINETGMLDFSTLATLANVDSIYPYVMKDRVIKQW